MFLLLGEENRDGTEPLDLMAVMDRLGWQPKPPPKPKRERRKK